MLLLLTFWSIRFLAWLQDWAAARQRGRKQLQKAFGVVQKRDQKLIATVRAVLDAAASNGASSGGARKPIILELTKEE
ncbi:unnamed protein product, partial [Amoebophrya sp. A25]